MAVKKIVYFGESNLQRAESHIEQVLSDWINKWFGKEVDWEVNLKSNDIDWGVNVIDIHELLDNEILANDVACMALNIDSENNDLSNSHFVAELGKSILSEFTQHLSPTFTDAQSEVIVNLHNPIETIELCVNVSKQLLVCRIPVSNILKFSCNENSNKKEYGVSPITANSISGTIHLDVELNGAEIKMRDLFALEVGDVLALEHSLNTPITVKSLGGGLLFEGRLGKTGEKKSMLITGSRR